MGYAVQFTEPRRKKIQLRAKGNEREQSMMDTTHEVGMPTEVVLCARMKILTDLCSSQLESDAHTFSIFKNSA